MWVHEWSWVTFRVHQLWIILSGWDRHRAPKRLKNRWSLSREINGTCLARSCFSANWFPTFFCNFRANKLGEFSESGQSARNWQCLTQQSGPTSEHMPLHWHDNCFFQMQSITLHRITMPDCTEIACIYRWSVKIIFKDYRYLQRRSGDKMRRRKG